MLPARFGATVDGDFFQQLIALQNENATLRKQSTELETLLQRRQESYIRRETKLQNQIRELEAKNDSFWNQHTSGDTPDEEYFQALQSELEDGLEALLTKQKLQLGASQIAHLEDIDEKLKKMECAFQRKTDRLSDLDTDRKLQNERAMNAIEELSELRKRHITLQQKYKDECLKTRELHTQLECSEQTEEILIKRLRGFMNDDREDSIKTPTEQNQEIHLQDETSNGV